MGRGSQKIEEQSSELGEEMLWLQSSAVLLLRDLCSRNYSPSGVTVDIV